MIISPGTSEGSQGSASFSVCPSRCLPSCFFPSALTLPLPVSRLVNTRSELRWHRRHVLVHSAQSASFRQPAKIRDCCCHLAPHFRLVVHLVCPLETVSRRASPVNCKTFRAFDHPSSGHDFLVSQTNPSTNRRDKPISQPAYIMQRTQRKVDDRQL